MNECEVTSPAYQEILGRFPESLQPMFVDFTPEELYYALKLLGTAVAKRDHFLWALKAKLVLFLRGQEEWNPLSPEQWIAVREEWLEEYLDIVARHKLADSIQQLKARYH